MEIAWLTAGAIAVVVYNITPLTINNSETTIPSALKKYDVVVRNESDSSNDEVRIIGIKAIIPTRKEYPSQTDLYLFEKAAHRIPIEKK